MGKGNIFTQVNDWINSFDPRVSGLAGNKGSLFRYIPAAGAPQLLMKQDNGFTPNWLPTGNPNQPFVYYVTPGQGDLPTIQSAIDQAFADGSGTGGIVATIFIPPGTYTENLTFQPGQCLVAQTSQVSVGAVKIEGQHTYTPPVNTDPLSVCVTLQGLTFASLIAGDIITILGTEGYFFSVNGCAFTKGVSGHAMNAQNVTGIFVAVGASSTSYPSPDAFIRSAAQVTVLQGCSHSSGGSAPLLDYVGTGSLNLTSNQCLGGAPYVVSQSGGTCFCLYNFFGAFAPNNDCIRVGAGALMYLTFNTLISSTGLGYVLQGAGTINGSMLVYGDSTAIDPGLTFNTLSSLPT